MTQQLTMSQQLTEEYCRQEAKRLAATREWVDVRKACHRAIIKFHHILRFHRVGDEVVSPKRATGSFRYFMVGSYAVPGSGYYCLLRDDGKLVAVPSVLSLEPRGLSKRVLKWNHGLIGNVAVSIRRYKRWSELPILADMLEEAGCSDTQLINSIRVCDQNNVLEINRLMDVIFRKPLKGE